METLKRPSRGDHGLPARKDVVRPVVLALVLIVLAAAAGMRYSPILPMHDQRQTQSHEHLVAQFTWDQVRSRQCRENRPRPQQN